jgi:DNA-binding NarL/FixJ family response regulator
LFQSAVAPPLFALALANPRGPASFNPATRPLRARLTDADADRRIEEVLAAVRSTAAGEAVFTPGLAGLVLGEYRRLVAAPAPGPDTPRLTERETEILRLVAKGLTYPQIAERLVLSARTVQNHVQNTLTKLRLHNKAQLVRYAIEQGID